MTGRDSAARNLRTAIASAVTVFIVGSMPAMATAVDTTYWSGYVDDQVYKSSALQSYLTGGRNGIAATMIRNTVRTVTSSGVVWASVEGSEGGVADMTHARVNNVRSQCKWRIADSSHPGGSVWIVCKYRK